MLSISNPLSLTTQFTCFSRRKNNLTARLTEETKTRGNDKRNETGWSGMGTRKGEGFKLEEGRRRRATRKNITLFDGREAGTKQNGDTRYPKTYDIVPAMHVALMKWSAE